MSASRVSRFRARWTVPTRILGYIVAVSSLVSVIALLIAVIALNSAVRQQAEQARKDSRAAAQYAAVEAARLATVDTACQVYRFSIGEPGDPPPGTARGRVQVQRAKQRSAELGCK